MEQDLLVDSVEEGVSRRSQSMAHPFANDGLVSDPAEPSLELLPEPLPEPLPELLVTELLVTELTAPNSGNQAVVDQVANYFRVLGEPMRLKLLNVLREGERCVQDLVEETETSQANVSKHLKVMLQAGILAKRNQGTQAFYRVTDDLIFELCNLVCDRLATRIEQQALHFRMFSLASKPGAEE
jgi:DNA-binding transcriptional ArsR family regulator